MWRTIFRNWFVWGFLIASIAIGFALVSSEKLMLHQGFNTYSSNAADTIFPLLTHLGDGLFAAVLILVMLMFFSIRIALGLLIAFGGSGIVAQVLKKMVFASEMRPLHFFRDVPGFHFVEGVSLHLEHSFPSGHATSAFAVFAFLALQSRKVSVQLLMFLFAILGAYSRVYLSQHFIGDIFAGMWLGTSFAVLSYIVTEKYIPGRLNKGILQIKKE
jgi:membrane-associated phospholipid phosphatase